MSVVWKAQDKARMCSFLDTSQSYFFPRIKLERWRENDQLPYKYEVYYTDRELYMPVEDIYVDYMYDNSIVAFSASVCLSHYEKKLIAIQQKGEEVSTQVKSELDEKLTTYRKKSIHTLEQINLNYGNKQRTIISTLQ